MDRFRLIGALSATTCIALSPCSAEAQGATNVIRLVPDRTQTGIQVGTHYTQVLFGVDGFTMPPDDDGKKQLGRAILSAFGLGEKTRSLTISAVLTRGGQALPEVPLITYSFDGSRRLTNYQVVNSYLTPRWQLGAGDVISVSLNYKYSEQISYDPSAITDNVKKLIPSDAIVSTLSAPFVQGVAGLAASVFQNAGTRSVTARNQDDLLPFPGAVGARGLRYSLGLPNGRPLGAINASLVVSPTLLRPAILATQATPNDLVRRPGEDVSAIQLDVAGGKKNLLQEVEGLASYAAMTKEPTPASVRDYCGRASLALSNYGVTTLDRTTLVYRSLLDAGFDPTQYHATANTWRTDCFSQDDRNALTTAIGLTFTPAEPPPPPIVSPADKWPKSLKSAMGCWITNKTGDWCQRNAPAPRASLEMALSDHVLIGVVDLPGIDFSTLPIGRKWDRANLLNALNGKADTFACYELGLILVKDGTPYSLDVATSGGAISGLQIIRAPAEAAQCLTS